jgi:hypothetical protein
MNLRVVVAAVAGAVVLSVLEFLTYGFLITDFINANRVEYAGLIKEPPNVVTFVLFNLVWCSLLAFIFDKWADIRTFAGGASAGAIIFAAVVLGINLGYVTFFNLLKNAVVVISVKLMAMAITGAITGGLMAAILGRMKGQAAA